jgi:hypothetical protein
MDYTHRDHMSPLRDWVIGYFVFFAHLSGFHGNLIESITQHNTLCVLKKTWRTFAMKMMFFIAEFRRVFLEAPL